VLAYCVGAEAVSQDWASSSIFFNSCCGLCASVGKAAYSPSEASNEVEFYGKCSIFVPISYDSIWGRSMQRLFEKSLYAVKEENLRLATQRVQALSEPELLVPSLQARLDTIADEFTLQVARLRPDERRGKRRVEQRESSDYGRHQVVEVSLIDVTIPFVGDPKSLMIAPSRCHVIERPAIANSNSIVVSLVDDENLDRNVDDFVMRVNENLDNLRSEMDSLRNEIKTEIQTIADRRLALVKAQKERDSKRSFPIE